MTLEPRPASSPRQLAPPARPASWHLCSKPWAAPRNVAFCDGSNDFTTTAMADNEAVTHLSAAEVAATHACNRSTLLQRKSSTTIQLGSQRLATQEKLPPETSSRHRRDSAAFSTASRPSFSLNPTADAAVSVPSPTKGPKAFPGRSASSTIALADDTPVPPKLVRAHMGKPARESASGQVWRYDVPLPPGMIATARGEIKPQPAVHSHAIPDTVHIDLHWDPETNAAKTREKHARRAALTNGAMHLSNVDEIVFNRDIDGSSKMAHSIKVHDEFLDWKPGKGLVPGQGALASPGKETPFPDQGWGRDPPQMSRTGKLAIKGAADQEGILAFNPHYSGGMHRSPPRVHSQAATAMYGDESAAPGAELPGDRHEALDFRGRALSTSLVDQAMFGKSPMGNRLNQVGVNANFMIDKRGEIGAR